MRIYIDGHSYHYETENLVRLFYPNEKINVINEPAESPEKPYIYTRAENRDGKYVLTAQICFDDFEKSGSAEVSLDDPDLEKTAERVLSVCLYELLCEYTGKTQPWGILTGVRPIKLFRRLRSQYSDEYAEKYFTDELKVSPAKTRLSAVTDRKSVV